MRPRSCEHSSGTVGGGARYLTEIKGSIRGTFHADHSVLNLKVLGAYLHYLRCHLEDAGLDVGSRVADGVAGYERRTRGERPGANRRRVGAVVVPGNPVEGHADRFGDDLGLDRDCPIANLGGA